MRATIPPPETTSEVPAAVSRRTFLKTGLALAGAAAAGSLGVALYEPHELSVERLEVRLPRLPRALDGFRIAQLSDIHFTDFMTRAHLRSIVQQTNALAPDLVLITGDFVTAPNWGSQRAAARDAWPCAEELRQLRASHGRMAVLGNHDIGTDPDEVTHALETNGIVVLRNRSLPVEASGGRLWLAGLDDVLFRAADLPRTLRGIPQGECIVAAVHEPDYADYLQKFPIDLQLSGHSHGGQVRFPLVGPLYLPPMARKYPIGFRRVGPLQLYTNRGVGVILLPLRLLCPPEVTLITLRAGQ